MLSKAVKFLRNSLLEDFGYPANLISLLREDGGLPTHLPTETGRASWLGWQLG